MSAAAAPIRLSTVPSYATSQAVLLPHEDQAAYSALAAHYMEAYRPETPGELDLVHSLHQTRWRIERLVAVEHGLIALGLTQSLPSIDARFGDLDDLTRQALAQAEGFVTNARTIEQLNRQESRLERQYQRLRIELEQLIASRDSASNIEEIADPAAAPAKPATQAGLIPSKEVPSKEVPSKEVPSKKLEPMPHFSGPMKDIKRKQWLRRQLKAQTAALNL